MPKGRGFQPLVLGEGHEVWLLPADCTWAEPLNEKEGYKIKWNGEAWEYEEIPVPPEPENEVI